MKYFLAIVVFLSAGTDCWAQPPSHQINNAGCPIVWIANWPHYDIDTDPPTNLRQVQISWDQPQGDWVMAVAGVFHGLSSEDDLKGWIGPHRSSLSAIDSWGSGTQVFHLANEQNKIYHGGDEVWSSELKRVTWVEITMIRFNNHHREWRTSATSHCEVAVGDSVVSRITGDTHEPISSLGCPINNYVWVDQPFHSVTELVTEGPSTIQMSFYPAVAYVAGIFHRVSNQPGLQEVGFQGSNVSRDKAAMWFLTFHVPALMESAEITKIRYKDGSEWTPTPTAHCRVLVKGSH